MNQIAARIRDFENCHDGDVDAAADEIDRLEKVIAEQKDIIDTQDETIEKKKEIIENMRETIDAKDGIIETLRERIRMLEDEIAYLDDDFTGTP